jgi:cell wall-associated NlpC family hydrolase
MQFLTAALSRALIPACATLAIAGTLITHAPIQSAAETVSRDAVTTVVDAMETDDQIEQVAYSRGDKVVDIAASKRGAPYAYGAAGPSRFDCSGFTKWVYSKVGEPLPHSSNEQVGRTNRVSRANARRGDLVFFTDGGRVYHVGIYAGDGYVWHSPKSGDHVRKAKIWTSSVFFGRVR